MLNVVNLFLDLDFAHGAVGARLADIAEVVTALAHPHRRVQVLSAGLTLEAHHQLLENLFSWLLVCFGHGEKTIVVARRPRDD